MAGVPSRSRHRGRRSRAGSAPATRRRRPAFTGHRAPTARSGHDRERGHHSVSGRAAIPREEPMTAVLQGIRILEVAEHTFVPAASALMADWGAEVIKIEHVERGDAMRGLESTGMAAIAGDVHALLEHSNRGKRSLALDLTSPDGLDILYKLAATSDVFLTNKLPSVRAKLQIGL